MSIETLSTEPNFFGKDSFVPFVGTVEDVDDPKRSNRVKVRIVGWHTDEKELLPTEDLPWAKVCMPATHAQQGRIGGKHGLLPGCWIIGFFMDGMSANDPYVLTTFNFTAKTTEENNRSTPDTSSGKIPKEEPGHSKILPGENSSTTATRATVDEVKTQQPTDKGDASGDTTLDASTDGDCPINISQAEQVRTKEPKSTGEKGNPESQNYKIGLADGVCGGIAGAREEIQNIMKEIFPPQVSRFAYGDLVWNQFTGEFINLNGSLLKIAQFVCSLLKYSIHTMKGFQEDTIQRSLKSTTIMSIPDRDGLLREAADFASSVVSDNFNASISEIIDSLCQIILGILQEINNSGDEDNRQLSDEESGGDNRNNRSQKGNVGATTTTSINDPSSLCITDELLFTVDAEITKKLGDAITIAGGQAKEMENNLQQLQRVMFDVSTVDMTCDDDINKIVEKVVEGDDNKEEASIKKVKESNYNPDPGISFDASGSFGDIASILGDSAQYVQLVLSLKFILFPNVFNKAGFQVLDEINRTFECISSTTRMFDTAIGKLGSISGVDFGGSFSGGGSNSGKSSKNTKEIQSNIGLGGSPISNQNKRPGEDIVLCEDAKTKKIKNKIEDRSVIMEWSPVDYYETGRTYSLKGEETFDNTRTNNSRILVNNQEDPTENGIYVTSAKEWKRSDDAFKSKQFTQYKIVKVRNVKRKKRWWIYVNNSNPKLGVKPIDFEPLYDKKKKSPKNLLDLIKEKQISDIAEVVDEDAKQELGGKNAQVILIGLPSSDRQEAENFNDGIPNIPIVIEPGDGYFNNEIDYGDFERNKDEALNPYPSIFLNNYQGTPIPVVDPNTGELVTILTNPISLNEGSKSVSVIKDNSSIGISSDDENYDIVLNGIFVGNTGDSYTEDVTIKIIDRDTGEENGKVKPVLIDNKIVDVEVINNGTGFKRIPKVVITDSLGVGAKLYPFMSLVPRNPDTPSVKKITESVNLSFCVAKNQVNLIRPGRR